MVKCEEFCTWSNCSKQPARWWIECKEFCKWSNCSRRPVRWWNAKNLASGLIVPGDLSDGKKKYEEFHKWSNCSRRLVRYWKSAKIFRKWSHYNGWPTQVKNTNICEFLERTPLKIFGCKSKKEIQLKDKLIISLKFLKKSSTTKTLC